MSARELEYYLPTYEAVSHWRDRRVSLQRPLFPGYLFVKISASEKMRVVTVPSVLNLLCSRAENDAICDQQIETLRTGLERRPAEPHPYMAIGARVRIVKGPFTGMEGILVGRRNALRAVINLQSIMRAFTVEVSMHEIAPATVSLLAGTA